MSFNSQQPVIDRFKIRGYCEDSSRVETLDLLKDNIIATRQVVRSGGRGRAIDSESAFQAISESYGQFSDEIAEGVDVSPMTDLPGFWRRNFLFMEAATVVLLTAVFALWYCLWEGSAVVNELLKDNKGNVYRTGATISASLLGFSMIATSIIFGLSSHERLELLRGSPHFSALWSTLIQTILSLAGLTVMTVVSLLLDKDSAPVSWSVSWLFVPFFFFVGLSSVRLLRTIWLLDRLTRIISRPSGR